MIDYRSSGTSGREARFGLPEIPICNQLDEQGVLNAGLAIEERAGFTARAEKWW